MSFKIPNHSLVAMFLLLGFLLEAVHAFQGIPGLYCGLENCYDILGVNKDSNKDEITKKYRNLARQWHPDRYRNSEKKAEATEKFRQIATAYEVLREDESRRDYNDMLDDPEHYYRHYYRYYKRVYGTKVDAHWVILGVISVISLYQYFVMHSRYNEAINYFSTVPKYRFKAIEMAKQRGLLPLSDKRSSRDPSTGAKISRHQSKEDMREQEESIIRRVIEDNIDIRGGVAKPDLKNILWIQIFRSPLMLYSYLCWKVRWIYLYDIKGEPYGEDEKVYLMCKYLGVSEDQLQSEEDVQLMLKQELWVKEKFEAWKKRRDEEIREKLAKKPGYKRYRRYMKKGGPGQITFLDD